MYEEDSSVSNEVTEEAIFIARPVSEVWTHFLDLGSWITSHTIEEISASKRTVGAITRVSFKRARDLGYPEPHYHFCKIIKMLPERQYVLKTYSEKGGSYGVQIAGFDDARFTPRDGGTWLTFAYYGEHRAKKIEVKPAAIDMDASVEGMRKNLENLKRIVETAAASP